MANVLIVDDEENIRILLQDILEDEGHKTFLSSHWEEAHTELLSHRIDMVLLDIWLPGMNGMDILDRLREDFVEVTVIMISGHGNIDLAVSAIKKGAFDFLEKPLSIERIITVVKNVEKFKSLEVENKELKHLISKQVEMIGTSASMIQIRESIHHAARSHTRVMITGENGTGKELIARSIHLQSNRSVKPFIEINCAAIPENLIESELFGHEKGSFTNAIATKKGKFELAHMGTIFLDEIADMTLNTQAKVLRVLQEMTFERVGGSATIKVDVRVIAATNKDLETEIREGRFREDLYYRLNVIPITVPPLRERREDIVLLVDSFLEKFTFETGIPKKGITNEAMNLLSNFPWPGNVRELKNIVERLHIMVHSDTIEESDVRKFVSEKRMDLPLKVTEETLTLRDAREQFEKEYIIQQLKIHQMNVSKTAEALEIERSHLHKKIKQYQIQIVR